MDWKALFLTPQGRIGQRDFWIGFVIIFAVNLVGGMIPIIGMVVGLIMIWPMICVYSKRLHDMGKSAWLMAIPFGVLIAAFVLAALTGGMAMISGGSNNPGAAMAGLGAAAGLMGLGGLIGFAFLLWVGLSKGNLEANQYGAPPASLTTAV
jgi:uncharacterized membrane protein YhaH (DUF805 family)